MLAARLQKLIATAPSPPLTRFKTTLSRAVASAPTKATAAAEGTPENPGRSMTSTPMKPMAPPTQRSQCARSFRKSAPSGKRKREVLSAYAFASARGRRVTAYVEQNTLKASNTPRIACSLKFLVLIA